MLLPNVASGNEQPEHPNIKDDAHRHSNVSICRQLNERMQIQMGNWAVHTQIVRCDGIRGDGEVFRACM
jgi:hypothetical protein